MICNSCNAETTNALCCMVCDTYLPNPAAGVRAGVGRRLSALLLDVCVIISVVLLLLLLLSNSNLGGTGNWSYFTICLVAMVVYLIIAIGFFACGLTPGKYLAGIRVVDKRNGNAAGFGRMFVREALGKYISGLFLGLGYFWAVWDRDSQAWHDKIAGTIVLREEIPQGRLFLGFAAFFFLFVGVCILRELPSPASTNEAHTAPVIINGPAYTRSAVVAPPVETAAAAEVTDPNSAAEAEITQELNQWASAYVGNDLQGEMEPYADTLDRYFLRRNVDRAFIEADKQKLYTAGRKFTSYALTQPAFEVDDSGAIAVTVKKIWQLDDNGTARGGINRSRYWFARTPVGWKITGEQNLSSGASQD